MRDKVACPFCKLVDDQKAETFVSRMDLSSLFVHRDQSFRGRCILILNRHVEDLTDLSGEEFSKFAPDLRIATKAIKEVFSPDLVNVAMLGNNMPHLHWHIIPRYADDCCWGNPPWPHDHNFLKAEEYLELSKLVQRGLEKRKRVDPVKYPKTPSGIVNLERYQGIKKAWDFSRSILLDLNEELNRVIEDSNVSVVVAGSFGRLDACTESDLDFFVIGAKNAPTQEEVLARVREVASRKGLKLPNPTGVFSQFITVPDTLQMIGSNSDTLVSLAQRMLLLMEARPIFNDTVYRNATDQILSKYLELVKADPQKEALFLLNEIIRYFRSICVNYQFNVWKEEDKWVMRNVKLRHSRIVMYAGLLLLVMNASKNRKDKFTYLLSKMHLSPIERIADVYCDNGDPNIDRVLGCYDFFLRRLTDKQVRDALKADYEARYSNSHYADLKVNSDSLQTELTRFIFARRGTWTDQIFEYLVF